MRSYAPRHQAASPQRHLSTSTARRDADEQTPSDKAPTNTPESGPSSGSVPTELDTDEYPQELLDDLSARSVPDFQAVEFISQAETRGRPNPLRVTREERKARKMARRGPDRTLARYTVPVPPEVTVTVRGTRFYFDGPLGSNAVDLLKADAKGMAAFKVERSAEGRVAAIHVAGPAGDVVHGIKTQLQNRIHGVVRGYLMYLQLVGVGFRVSKETREVSYLVHE